MEPSGTAVTRSKTRRGVKVLPARVVPAAAAGCLRVSPARMQLAAGDTRTGAVEGYLSILLGCLGSHDSVQCSGVKLWAQRLERAPPLPCAAATSQTLRL